MTLKARSLLLLLVGTIVMAGAAQAESPPNAKYAIALHGGAGDDPAKLTNEQRQAREASLREALRIGVEALKRGEASLDVVEKVIRHLEDDPHFNAGRGAVFNADGGHELNASIMDGR